MALYADVETHKQAQVAMQTRTGELGGKDHTEVSASFAETTRQSVENRQVNGMSQLMSKTVVHPISQEKIYVVAYGVSGQSATEALGLEYSAFQSAAEANRSNNANRATGEALHQLQSDSKAEEVGANVLGQKSSSTNNKQIVSKSKTLLNAPDIDEDDF